MFHAFMYCNRLRPLFSLLQDVFKWFDEVFSMEIFICGFKYSRKRSFECQLFNFLFCWVKRKWQFMRVEKGK